MNTIWLAFQVYEQHAPTPDDIIVVSTTRARVMNILRERVADQKRYLTTCPNPLFDHEVRCNDTNDLHSYIGIKELPVL